MSGNWKICNAIATLLCLMIVRTELSTTTTLVRMGGGNNRWKILLEQLIHKNCEGSYSECLSLPIRLYLVCAICCDGHASPFPALGSQSEAHPLNSPSVGGLTPFSEAASASGGAPFKAPIQWGATSNAAQVTTTMPMASRWTWP